MTAESISLSFALTDDHKQLSATGCAGFLPANGPDFSHKKPSLCCLLAVQESEGRQRSTASVPVARSIRNTRMPSQMISFEDSGSSPKWSCAVAQPDRARQNHAKQLHTAPGIDGVRVSQRCLTQPRWSRQESKIMTHRGHPVTVRPQVPSQI